MPRPPFPAVFLPDGYTRHTRIDAGELYPTLSFEYRPMLTVDRAALLRRITLLAPDGGAGLAAAEAMLILELARRLISWTLASRRGTLVEISPQSLRRMETHLLAELTTRVLDLDSAQALVEATNEQNLMSGVQLLVVAPHLAARSCADCVRHVYDEQTGRRQTYGGQPVVRPLGTHPPCRLPHVGCLKGTPENSRALNAVNQQVYRHHTECRAVGNFPDDPIVRRHAALIRSLEEVCVAERVEGFKSSRVKVSLSSP